jgi:hypothetical protein
LSGQFVKFRLDESLESAENSPCNKIHNTFELVKANFRVLGQSSGGFAGKQKGYPLKGNFLL